MCLGKKQPEENPAVGPDDTYLECSIKTNADKEALSVLKSYCATKLLEILREDAQDTGASSYYSEPLDRFQ